MRREELSRRMFVRAASLAAAGLAIKPASVLAVKRAGAKRAICVFSKHLQWLDYDAMAETAAEIGFDGVDLSVRPGGHVLPERVTDDLPRAVEAVRKAGLHVPMMTSKIQNAGDRYTEPVLKTASSLGIGYYRMGYLNYDDQLGVAGSLERLKSTMADLAAVNEKYHIHGAYQNHAGTRVGGPVWDLWELLKDLDANWMGCQYDVRHATVEGGSSWPLGMKLLSPFIRTTVIKDFWWEKKDGKWKIANVPLGEGMVDFKQYFKLVKSLNIGGPISMHFEYPIYDKADKNLSQKQRRRQTIEVMKKDLLKLRSMLKEAGLD
jgi:L-ribulose-5-phosphate 3-epimerase